MNIPNITTPWLAKIKLTVLTVLVTAVVVAVSYLYISNNQLESKVTTQAVTISENEKTIGALTTRLEAVERTAKVNEMAVDELSKRLVELDQDRRLTAAKQQATIDAIRRKYSLLPATDENKALLKQEIDVVKIDGIWDAYCKNNPTKCRR